MSVAIARTARTKFFSCAGALALAAAGAVVNADAEAAEVHVVAFNLPAQSLEDALKSYGVAADRQVMVSTDLVEGKKAPAVIGEMTPDAALARLLDGSGLAYRVTASNVVLIGSPGEQQFTEAAGDSPRIFRVAETSSRKTGAVATFDEEGDDGNAPGKDEVVATGTRIKGMKDQFSPVTQIGRDEIDIAGYGNVSDVFNGLPQNFGGDAALDTVAANDARGVGGAGANLRGLGNEATLVLVNGRRMANGGLLGGYVDVSAIPASAIDRIEVMTDGASAIYGSDAVAGVVNIILRDDFQGAETRLGMSTTADGSADAVKAAQTIGWSNERAHGLVAYEYASENELNARDKDFAAGIAEPHYLLPFSQKNSVFASGGAALSDVFSVSADGYYNKRKTKSFTSLGATTYFQNFGSSDVEQYGAAGGVNVRLFSDWESDVSAAFSRSNFDAESIRLDTMDGSGTIGRSESGLWSVDATLGGSLFAFAGESVRTVIGAHYRSENVKQFAANRLTGDFVYDIDKSRDVFAAFGELYAPLISESSAIPAVSRFAVTVAARYEDYSDVGSSFDPKFGAVWSPVEGVNIRGTFGSSFRAATLEELVDRHFAYLSVFADPQAPGGESVALRLFGTSADIAPEQATAWTVGLDLAPEKLNGLTARGTYFHISYDDRIGSPSLATDAMGRYANFAGTPVRNPDAETVQALAGAAVSLFDLTGGAYNLGDVTVLLDQRTQNLTASEVAGVDIELAYDLPSAMGDWRFSFNATALTKFTRQTTPLTPALDLLNTYGNPVDLKLRGGVIWRTQPVTAAVHLNYVDGYTDDKSTTGPVPVKSWTTVDASLRFDLGRIIAGRIAEGALLTVSATNLLNQDPPAIGERSSLVYAFYDPANADPAGRRLGLLLTKTW